MRILSISQNHYVAGGMDRMMFEQARILEERGHVVVPFTAADPADHPSPWAAHFPPAARTDHTPLAEVPATLYRPAAARALRDLMRKEAFDVVHLHSWYKRLSPAILPVLRDAGVPVVQTLHEYRTVCSRSTMFRDGTICRACAGGRRWPALVHRCNGSLPKTMISVAEMVLADRLGYRQIVRRFLPVSDFQRELLCEMGMPDARMRTLPNPVGIPDAHPMPPAGADGPVLFVGRLESYKGVDLFVALARMRPDVRFVMAGDGSARSAIEARQPANLTLLGKLDSRALLDVVRGAACVVVPSLWPEAFGLTAIEALAAGTPVIASRTGGLAEIVRDGIDGFLVASGDQDGFAAAVDRILADPVRARAMGAAGRAHAAEAFSEDQFCARLTAIYHEAIAEGASR
ncbi:glycosyltransferase family 4 protein [Sphingomonas sp. Leaf4]|uniref:glycosyltransferase family 4 protein n=1 Tax=Sphingomonas sp. Leaf4 TaxID=2876553 RepID=UPI001E4C6A31|nr:glycosyltransferase family 4 protein [Sphingomonas sp. Leaf4]